MLWIIGFVIEEVARRQKSSFSNAPENHDKFINQGAWAFSRRPNYFVGKKEEEKW